ncbi:hypothetical protein RHSIM_Rhsim01G0117800 [Rhododendron simsii]|uniref:Uncharacterized protein n=1 Tax=Rhododendron simsii TaxID=118357 RepID=A0A834HQ38_RHOSS|nr:hypothetical protein RHSIM_Rhsim01G0117800 [Rhododendron simsii]
MLFSPSRENSPLLALCDQFRKAFLILNYTGRRKLAEHMKVDDIMMLKDLPMRDFVTKLWDAVVALEWRKGDRKENDMRVVNVFLVSGCLIDGADEGDFVSHLRTYCIREMMATARSSGSEWAASCCQLHPAERIATEDRYDADHHNHDHYHYLDDPIVWTLVMPGTFVMRKGKGALCITEAQQCSSSHEYVPMDISG